MESGKQIPVSVKVNEELKIRCWILDHVKQKPVGKNMFLGYVFDLSCSGIGLIVDSPVETGNLISADIRKAILATNKNVMVTGIVMHCEPYRDTKKYLLGVKFVTVAAEDKKRIEDFVKNFRYSRKKQGYYGKEE